MKFLSVIVVVAWAAVGTARAQTNPVNTATEPQRDGKIVVPERPTVTDTANLATAEQRPTRSERAALPPEVQAQIERLRLDARAYLEQQQALKKKLEGANDKERALIREQLRELQQLWQERAKEMRREYKDRQAELAEKLKEYRELLDNVRSTTLRDSGRTRRGDD